MTLVIISSLLLRVNAIQHRLADGIISYTQNSLGLPIKIKRVNILSFNKLEVDSILLNDLGGDTLAAIDKVIFHISLPHLLKNQVKINNLTLGNPTVQIRRETASSPTNAQFLINLLAGNDSTPSKPLPQIRVNQLHLYDGRFSYDILSSQQTKGKKFDPSHIGIGNITATISLKHFSPDSVNLHIRKISGREQSGLCITGATAKLTAADNRCTVEQFRVELPNGYMALKDSTLISYRTDGCTRIPYDIRISGNIYSNRFSPRNLSAFVPKLRELSSAVQFNTPFKFSNGRLTIENATVASTDKAAWARYNATIDTREPAIKVSVEKSNITTKGINRLFAVLNAGSAPQEITAIGNISLSGNAEYSGNKLLSTLSIESDAGKIEGEIKPNATGGHNCTLNGKGIDIGRISGNRNIGKANAAVNITYSGMSNNFPLCHIYSHISNLTFNGYHYAPIRLTANIREREIQLRTSIDDNNLESDATLNIDLREKRPSFALKLNVDTIRPYNLALTKKSSQGILSFSLESKLNGTKLDSAGCTARIRDLILRTPDKNNKSKYRKVDNINLVYNASGAKKILTVDSDLINGHLTGNYSFETLHNSFLKILGKHLPSLSQEAIPESRNNFVFDIEIRDSEILGEFVELPFGISERSNIGGSCNDERELLNVNGSLNGIEINKKPFDNITIAAEHKLNGIYLNIAASNRKQQEITAPNSADIEYKCLAHNDTLTNVLRWYTRTKEETTDVSKLRLDIALHREENDRLQTAVHIHNSTILFNGQKWNISESLINSKGRKFNIDHLRLSNDNRRISVDGTIGENQSDSLSIELNDIKVEEVLDLVNFRAVSFSGIATGGVKLSGLLDTPRFNSRLFVQDFHFEEGYMGNLTIESSWLEKEKAVYLCGLIEDKEYESKVEGIVSTANDSISLEITADGINAEFLQYMISSILTDVELRAYGNLAVRGKFSDINLYGKLMTSGELRVKSTNTKYRVHDENALVFVKDTIAFDNFRIYDHRDSCGTINGVISHRALKNWGCNFGIAANNMQAFDTHTFNDDGYYGTAYITGGAQLRSDSNGLFIDVDATAKNGSKFIYNSASPLGAANNNFVTFVDRNKKNSKETPATGSIGTQGKLRLKFKIGVTPDIQLRVYTNTVNDDYIDIYSRGTVDVVYDNKEEFKMAGNLELERGTYKFTLQNIFPKEFAIRSGSIKFNGKPFDAMLDLHTAYTIPSVPLTDLNLTAGRRNSVKVNCLMDITGTLQEPALSFGLELPEGNEEERELLSSSISTPEQTNMQFMYLVAVGKFYTYDYNNMDNSQSSTMMESLISSTLSGQLNNMLSLITDNENWDISGNFTTSEKGWNSMEVEGMIKGRLLNNRLLINGNLGYRDNPYSDRNFVGDFDVQYIIDKKGIMRIRGYSKTNDRYFSRTDLTTRGAGIMLQHEFSKWIFWKKKKKKTKENKKDTKQ